MAKTLYEKTTRALVRDMLAELGLQPGQVLTTTRALEWFGQRYPKIQEPTIRAHLRQASTNEPSRLHHPPITSADDLLFKIGRSQYRLYEPGKDPAPIHDLVEGDVAREEELEQEREAEDEADLEDEARAASSSEFLLEKDLQRYLAENLSTIEPGLVLYESDGMRGFEFEVGGRRIDILALDKSGSLVVLELKVSRGYDRVVGQLLRYMNWLRLNVAAQGQRVRGMIVCRTMSEDLRLACASIGDVELFEYSLSVTVKKVPPLDLPKPQE
ncbi:MAG: DUF91 domain-containing protein [Rudaea sp.]|uniref:endonuclease NucS domain-containing protein n=1 Tax=unclassified Rudaea TaxID=2627037 RepID=UPI0010F7A443|nr:MULTISPECIES: endonuclease NucS domain-containing protein [unclassified Rudaea]MBN8884456.1 DUF91 domain-containing protein [Rudaea sp.]